MGRERQDELVGFCIDHARRFAILDARGLPSCRFVSAPILTQSFCCWHVYLLSGGELLHADAATAAKATSATNAKATADKRIPLALGSIAQRAPEATAARARETLNNTHPRHSNHIQHSVVRG